MAWLQNLAGRAEDLLNKIDQNAATVLSEPQQFSEIEILPQEPAENQIIDRQYDGREENGQSSNYDISNSVMEKVPLQDDLNSEVILNVISDEQSQNTRAEEDNVEDISIRSLVTIDNMSTSSLHNSFILAEDSQLLHEKIAKLESGNQEMNKQFMNLKHMYSEQRNENTILKFQVERANEQVAEAQLEKHQYIARAQKILQEKEKLQLSNIEQDPDNTFLSYNEEMKRELEFQQTKCEKLAQENEHLVKELKSLQMQHQSIQSGFQTTIRTLEYSLENEKKIRTIAEEDCLQKNKELFEKNKDFSEMQELLKVKNTEINHLNEIVKHKINSGSNEDIESRIKSLTQTLMMKQNALETVTTERNAYKLQFEKMEGEYKKILGQLQRFQVKVVNIEEQDDSLPLPKFMRVSPFDAGVTRRVKKAYSTLDAVSIRTGIFLRRYPVARVFVFCYMVLLHIWVLIILFWYAPSNP